MRAHFSSQTLAEILRDLFVAERDGVLVLTREESEQRLHFSRGLLVYADSNAEGEDLGQMLVRQGDISEGALDEALAHCPHANQLAEVLVRRDLIARRALAEAMQRITRHAVGSVFRWQGGTAQFHEGSDQPNFVHGDVLETVETILAGVRQMAEFQPIADAMLGLDHQIRLNSTPPLPLERLRLSPSQGYVLSRIGDARTVSEVVQILPDDEGDLALRFLFGLLAFGVVEYVPPLADGPFRVANILRDHADRQALEKIQERTIVQAYETLPSRDPYEVLGVSPSAPREAIDRAYEEAKAIFGKDRILPHLRERYRSELAVIESRLIESYLTLSKPDGERISAAVRPPLEDARSADDLLVRVEMDKTKAKIQIEEAVRIADDYYAKAKKAMREGDFHNAIQFSKLAISYNKEDARYYFMLADCQARNPEARWQRMAEENYTRATQLDPWNPEYLVRLGCFYKKRGLNLRAIKQFEEALKLAPTHESASRELANLRK